MAGTYYFCHDAYEVRNLGKASRLLQMLTSLEMRELYRTTRTMESSPYKRISTDGLGDHKMLHRPVRISQSHKREIRIQSRFLHLVRHGMKVTIREGS